jgi:hypothetical protein
MTNKRHFIEERLLNKMALKQDLAKNRLDDMPLKDSQISEWHYVDGYIAALNFVLANQTEFAFHDYTSEILIKDVLASIIPHIESHSDECNCNACVTNDVLQYFMRDKREEEIWPEEEGVVKKW